MGLPQRPNGYLNSSNSFNSSWPTLDKAALYGLAGDIVRKMEPHTESDPAGLLVQILVFFGNVIGRRAHFRAEADKHFGNLFAVLVGNTGHGRKGTGLGRTRGVYETIDPQWLANETGGLSSGEGLIMAVCDPIERQDPVKEKGRVTGYETVVVNPGVKDKRLLVVEPEFCSVLRCIGRPGNTASTQIRQAWDTGNLRVLTKNSSAKATNAHISIIGHITKDELQRELDATEKANGFANRFLWCCVARARLLPEGGQFYNMAIVL